MNIIHNPTLATITEAQVLLEPRVQTLLLKYSLQYDTSQKARPQAQAMSLSLKFRYTRKLLHLPRCRGIVLPLMLQEILVLNCPRTSNCSLGCSVATPKPTHTHEHNYAWSRLGGRGKKKKKVFSVMLARKENNSTYKETSRVTYEEDFMLGFLPIREELKSLAI